MPQLANCDRCGRQLQVATTRKETSKPFRKSLVPKGLCPECVVTQFLYNTYPVNMIIDEAGPELLLKGGVTGWCDPNVPAGVSFAAQAMVAAGIMNQCEMDIREVDWQRVVDNWNLPVKIRKSSTNPYRMGEAKRELPRNSILSPNNTGSLVVRNDPVTGELLVNDRPAREVDPELADSLEGLMGALRKGEKPQ